MNVLRSALLLGCLLIPSLASAQRLRLSVKLGELQESLERNPDDALAHYNVALGYWSKEKWDATAAHLDTAVTIDPRFAQARLALAYLPYAKRPELWDELWEEDLSDSLTRVVDEARRQERHAYLIDPLVDRTIIGATLPSGGPVMWSDDDYLRELYEHWAYSFGDFIDGNFKDAFYRYDRLLHEWKRNIMVDQDKPPVPWVWYKALAAARIGRYDDARAGIIHLYRRSLAEEEGEDLIHLPLRTNEYRYMRAVLEDYAGNERVAIGLYRDALEHDLGLYMAHVRLADIYEADDRYEEAVQERLRAVHANPDDPTLLMDLGVTLGKAGRFEEAEGYLTQAHEANPRHAMTLFWLGLVQMQLHENALAKATLTQFVEMAPARYQSQLTLARENLASLQ